MKLKVTPDMAKAWIEKADENYRRLQKTRVTSLARAMASGNWKYNGESIKFNSAGQLVDGQHRLSAVVQSGVSIETEVVEGVDHVDEIDTGKPRTAGDVLHRHGYINANNLAAAAKMLLDFKEGCMFTTTTRPKSAFLAIVRECPGLVNSVSHGCTTSRRAGLRQTVYSFSHYAFGRSDASERDDFFELLATGEDLQKGHPVLTLREFLVSQVMKPSHMRVSQEYLCAAIIKAWNCYLADIEMSFVRYSKFKGKEKFPTISGFEFYTPEIQEA